MRERLWQLLEPLVVECGFELIELELHFGPQGVLRLYIDRVDADPSHPITVEDCEKVSRLVSQCLDEQDPIPGEYALEVSSPGFDRPLRTLAHFERHLGCRLKVETLLPIEGRKRWTGELIHVQGKRIELRVDGQEVTLDHSAIKSARVVPDFG
jgi:ribosome maturation factor RimP